MIPRQVSRTSSCFAQALAVAAVVACHACAMAQAQPEPSVAAYDDSVFVTAKYYGSKSCQTCHAQGEAYAIKTAFELVSMTEFTTWHAQDKHSQAYCVLETPAAEKIGERLGWKEKVTRRRECLSCHAIDVPDDRKADGGLVRLQDGVSCDGCHGPAEKWFAPHTLSSWRKKTGVVKFNEFGMIDVRDPVARSKMCASCHIGNHEQGKVVTHEMYAAGHPPLPAFEVATFSRQLPRHWTSIGEKLTRLESADKETAVLDDFIRANRLDKNERTESKFVLIGGVVALRESMQLVVEQTKGVGEDATTGEPPAVWPEFGQFDCYACHHELRSPSWRQELGFAGPPGRIYLRSWPNLLARTAASIVDGRSDESAPLAKAFDEQRESLMTSLRLRPFGQRQKLHASAAALVGWSDEVLDRLTQLKYDDQLADDCLKALASVSIADLREYDSARQWAWALRTVHQERHGEYGEGGSEPDGLAPSFKDLAEVLRLDFPARAIAVTDDAADTNCSNAAKEAVVLTHLADPLEAIAAYAPLNPKLKEAITAIRAALAGE
jgi:hypothetical protein